MSVETMNIILPVGISFYTFQTLSYTIDVYRKKIKPTKNVLDFAAYVAFFHSWLRVPLSAHRIYCRNFKRNAHSTINMLNLGFIL